MADEAGDEPGGIDDPRATRFDGGRREADLPRRPAEPTWVDQLGGPSMAARRAHASVNLPRRLRERFDVVERLPNPGAEGAVYRVHDTAAGEERILKLYREEVDLDRKAIDTLLAISNDPTGQRYVVRLYEVDRADGLWYELQEYCVGGSLRSPRPDRTIGVDQLIAQVGRGLAYLQGKVVFRDIKPANLFLRTSGASSGSGIDVVLGDFGLVRTMADFTVRITRRGGTPWYLPPEGFLNKMTAGWDWWSFGMVLAEVALGRHPLAPTGDDLPDEDGIPSLVTDETIDLSGIEDERLRLLCQGLLLRDYRKRWRAEQFEQWLAGEDPPLPADVYGDEGAVPRAQDPVEAAARTPTRRVPFAGHSYADADELAVAFQRRWRYALDRLVVDRNDAWVADVEAFLRERELLGAAQTVAHLGPDTPNPSKALAGLLLDMSLQIEPLFDGLSLTADGLCEAAEAVLAGRMTSARLESVRHAGVLDLWHRVDGIADGKPITHPWDDGAQEIDRLVADVAGAGTKLHRATGDRAKAWVLLTLLGDEHRDRLDEELAAASETAAVETEWWAALATDGATSPAAAALAVVTARQAGLAPEGAIRDELSEREDRLDELQATDLERLRRLDDQPFAGLGGSRIPRPRWLDRRLRGHRLRGSSVPGRSRPGFSGFRARPPRSGMLALVVGGGLAVAHLLLLDRFEPRLRSYYGATTGADPLLGDPLSILDGLERWAGLVAGAVALHTVVVLVGRRLVDGVKTPGRRRAGQRAHHLLEGLTRIAVLVAVVGSGLIDMLLGDAAGGYREAGFPAGFLPGWSRALPGVFGVAAVGAVVAAGLTVVEIVAGVIDPRPGGGVRWREGQITRSWSLDRSRRSIR